MSQWDPLPQSHPTALNVPSAPGVPADRTVAYPRASAARPPSVTVAAAMAFIQAGWCLLLGFLFVVLGRVATEYITQDLGAGVILAAGLVGLALGVLLIVGGVKVLGGGAGWRVGLNVLLVMPLIVPNLPLLLGWLINPDPSTTAAMVLVLALVAASVIGLVALNLRQSSGWFIARAHERLWGSYVPTGAPTLAWPN